MLMVIVVENGDRGRGDLFLKWVLRMLWNYSVVDEMMVYLGIFWIFRPVSML